MHLLLQATDLRLQGTYIRTSGVSQDGATNMSTTDDGIKTLENLVDGDVLFRDAVKNSCQVTKLLREQRKTNDGVKPLLLRALGRTYCSRCQWHL